MAYGNLPGGGFSGFIKAEKPLLIDKRKYVPIKDHWPPKYGVYGEKLTESKAKRFPARSVLKTKERKKAIQPDVQPEFVEDKYRDTGHDPYALPEKPKKISVREEKKTKRVTFDGKYLEDFSEKFTEKEKTKRVIRKKAGVTDDDDDDDYFEDGDKVLAERKAAEIKIRPDEEIQRKISTKDDKYFLDDFIRKREFEAKRDGRLKEIETGKYGEYGGKIISDGKDITVTKKVKDFTEIDISDESEDLEERDEVVFFPKGKVPAEEATAEKEKEMRVKFRRPRRVQTYTYYKRKRSKKDKYVDIRVEGTSQPETPSFLRFCPCLDRLLHSKRTEYRGWKAMLGFPIGAMFGFGLYWIILYRMGAGRNYFWLLGTCVGIGFALSTQVRCICFLSIPACCGRAGRAFVSTYVVAYVIEGPLANILSNGKEAMRSISCTTSLNLNHSVERFKLMFKPVKEVVMDFVGAGDKVQGDAKQLEKTFSDIENEVRDENEVKEAMADVAELDDEIGGESRVNIIKRKFRKKKKPQFGEDSEKKYGMKSEFRCEEVFTKGVRGCYDSFGKAYDRCHSYLPIIGYFLCWPMKLTFICDLTSSMMGKRSCDSDVVMNPGFGASVDTADGVQSEFDKDFAVQLQYKLIIPEESVDQLVPEDISEAMKYSFERRKRNLDFFTQLVDRMLALLFLLVLNSSRKYCNQYLRVIQFDNKYVTSYFRHIDARRRKSGKVVLLPLKKGEKLELLEPFSVKFSAEEKTLLIINGLRLVSETLTVTILLMFDRIFYELLDLIKRHAHVTYKQTGVHHIKMTIYGDGFVGNMVRGVLKGFDKKHSADQVTTTEKCLPLPTKLPREMIERLYLVFLLMMMFIILESYALRLRRVICAFFYPKREKRRILFLYNDRLKKRRSFLQHMRHKVRKQAREQAISVNSGVLFSLRYFYPKYFNWMSKLGLGLAQCVICNEKESKSRQNLITCPECPFSYCSECWKDTEGTCYVCLPDYDTEPSENSASDDEQER